jgi:hypothetical protein
MNPQKALQVTKMIEEMIDIKLRFHDREHHPKTDEKEAVADGHQSVVDRNALNALHVNLPRAIADLNTQP